jgi:L-fuconolactonase
MTQRPILDTHIHLFEVTRPGGVPWPPAANKTIHRDTLPAHYKDEALPLGVVGAGIVEASPLHGDTRWVLDQIAGDPFFPFLVAQLPIGAPDFEAALAEIAEDPRVVGIRAFLWSPRLTLDQVQLEHLRALAGRGMTLDIISRGDLNPKDRIAALADAVPSLRIIVDHLAGAKGDPGGTVDQQWASDLRKLASRPRVHLKLSALFDMWNPAADENQPWTAPKDARSYAPWFDLALEAFGAQRVLFGSNWPVNKLAGSLAEEIDIVEDYLRPLGPAVRDRVMHDNAREFYRRVTG